MIGRFISADTIVPGANPLTLWPGDAVAAGAWSTKGSGPANAQDLNRYSYALNNPLKYTDPTGHVVTLSREEAYTFYQTTFKDLLAEVSQRNANETRVKELLTAGLAVGGAAAGLSTAVGAMLGFVISVTEQGTTVFNGDLTGTQDFLDTLLFMDEAFDDFFDGTDTDSDARMWIDLYHEKTISSTACDGGNACVIEDFFMTITYQDDYGNVWPKNPRREISKSTYKALVGSIGSTEKRTDCSTGTCHTVSN